MFTCRSDSSLDSMTRGMTLPEILDLGGIKEEKGRGGGGGGERGGSNENPSMQELWIFSGTTQIAA